MYAIFRVPIGDKERMRDHLKSHGERIRYVKGQLPANHEGNKGAWKRFPYGPPLSESTHCRFYLNYDGGWGWPKADFIQWEGSGKPRIRIRANQ